MKKLKEFLWFAILFVLISVLPIFAFILRTNNSGFIGGMQYLKLFFQDKVFQKALINTYTLPLVVSFLLVSVFTLLCRVLRHKVTISERIYRVSSLLIGVMGSFIIFAMMGVQTSEGLVGLFGTGIWITDLIFSLQVGILIAFIFWLIQSIERFIIRKKENKNEH
ncbi:MAG: hypothetical protein IJ333_02805 [Clostridia bacterium]|nr:hypothetical protein [Clostridia bacterium]